MLSECMAYLFVRRIGNLRCSPILQNKPKTSIYLKELESYEYHKVYSPPSAVCRRKTIFEGSVYHTFTKSVYFHLESVRFDFKCFVGKGNDSFFMRISGCC